MQFYKERILNAAQLKRLSEHKYSCTSASILDAWLQPWWCWLVSKTPLWLAPNLITIVGLIINVVTTLILVWYCPDARTDPPRWACALCAAGVFIYQSLDAIDGKQARRTGSQSPLGELFDHGCDSISTVFIALGACIAVKLGEYPTWMFFQCFCAMTLFYCAHWQAYVTGTLKMGRIDVTEAQYSIIIIHMVSAILGAEIWTTQVGGGAELRWSVGGAAVLAAVMTLGALAAAIMQGGVGKNGSTVAMPVCGAPWSHAAAGGCFAAQLVFVFDFVGTFRVRGCGKNGSTVALPKVGLSVSLASSCGVVVFFMYLLGGYLAVIVRGGVGKNGSTVAGTSILSPVIPFSLVVVPAFIIFQKSESHVYENHPALYIITFGMVAAKVTNRLVVAHMTKSEMDYYDWSLLGPGLLFLNQYFNNALPEYFVLWLATIWVVVDLVRYCGQICLEICEHLKIHLFRIPPPSAAALAGKSPPHHERNVSSESERSESEDSAPLINNNSLS